MDEEEDEDFRLVNVLKNAVIIAIIICKYIKENMYINNYNNSSITKNI